MTRAATALSTLCVTQITSWGVLFYAFPVLAVDITADTGWSMTAITAAFSACQLVAAVVGIPVGRWLDRRGPRGVMTAGSALGAPAIVAVAAAPGFAWFLVAWLVAGVAMAAVFYQPAFAAVTRWYGPDPVRALTVLTLAGGLASTVFAPLAAALATRLDLAGELPGAGRDPRRDHDPGALVRAAAAVAATSGACAGVG